MLGNTTFPALSLFPLTFPGCSKKNLVPTHLPSHVFATCLHVLTMLTPTADGRRMM